MSSGRCPPGGARVVYARTADLTADLRARFEAVLSEDERRRRDRFRFERDRELYLLAHGMLRCVLGDEAGTRPEALVFRTQPQGRPELAQPEATPRLRFNLTHTHGLAACVVAMDREVGIDAERIDRDVDIELLSRRVFSTEERARIDAAAGSGARARFFEHWTLKEAYVKAVGKGLSLPLRNITALPATKGTARLQLVDVEDDAERWCLRLHRLGEDHQLAVALDGPTGAEITFERFELHS